MSPCFERITSWREPEVMTMVEFASEPQRTFNPIRLYIIGGILVLLVALFFILHHYNSRKGPANPGASTVVVPGLLRSGDTNFEYYKTRIKIENVKASLGISFNNTRIALIEGKILNDGDRKLEAVELHIILYDKYGKISKERTAFALRPGTGLTGKPMEPLERRVFTIGVESIEVLWDPTQITYEITGLKYQ